MQFSSLLYKFQSETLVIKLPQKSRLEVTRAWPRLVEMGIKRRKNKEEQCGWQQALWWVSFNFIFNDNSVQQKTETQRLLFNLNEYGPIGFVN